MLHSLKRWTTQNIINRSSILKKTLFAFHSKYVNIRTRREALKRIKTLKAENNFDLIGMEKRNVLFIVIDCLRFKNTSLASYERDTTPFLKAFGEHYKAITGAPWTYPSVPTILTGLYPTKHGAYIHSRVKHLDNLKNLGGIRRNIITLPELFLYVNYDVYMATSIELSSLHFRRRIPDIRWYPGETRAEKILSDFLKWVNKRKKPFFAYLHLGDTHEPLNPPKEYWNFFGKVKKLRNIEKWDYVHPRDWTKPSFKKYVKNRVLLYDNTARYVNDELERFFEELKKLDVLDNTLVVITADHGEEFWEHAEIEAKHFYDPRGTYGVGHGHNVFNEIVEVPLVLWGFKGLKDKKVVSTTDITPTVFKELGIIPKYRLDGIPIQEKEYSKRIILIEATGYGYEKKALYWKDLKFLYAPDDKVKWIFNLKKDPNEQNPITDFEIAEIFEQKLKKYYLQHFFEYNKLKRIERGDRK